MQSELTMLDKFQAIPLWLTAGIFRSIYRLSITGTVLILYLRELGMDVGKIGTLFSIMPFLGIFTIVIAPYVEKTGLKKTCVMANVIRIFLTSLLIGIPFYRMFVGQSAEFAIVAVIFIVVSLANYTFFTADGSWSQQLIPAEVRARVMAMFYMFVGAATATTLAMAWICMKFFPGILSFQIIILIGAAFGFFSAVLTWRLPGGLPVKKRNHNRYHLYSMLEALKNKKFCCLMTAVTMIHLSLTATVTFIPLYMKDIVGLSNGQVVISAFFGSIVIIVGYYFWGWTADRYGAKPVFLVNTVMLLSFAPLWYVMKLPHTIELRFLMAVFVAAYGSVFGSGWIIGFDKYLYNNILPPRKKTSYISLVHAWAGLAAGAGPLLAGWFLVFCQGLDTTVLGLHFDQYTPMFIVYLIILIVGVFFVSRLESDTKVSTAQFAVMFLQPGPLSAMSTVLRYRFARDESDRVKNTRNMGSSSNPLNVNELVESLNDPSFNVRYEAVITIANRKPDSRLTDALIDILLDPDPELASSAAWALGRIGDRAAIPALREALAIPYPLLQARAGRALGMLCDTESAQMLMFWLKTDADPALKRACAAALGALEHVPALAEIVRLLRRTKRASFRGELATAAARIIGSEQKYVKLLRDCKSDLSTAAGTAILDIKKTMMKKKSDDYQVLEVLESIANGFSKNDFAEALGWLSKLGPLLKEDSIEPEILETFDIFTEEFSNMTKPDVEFVSLAIHACGTIIVETK